MPKGSVEFLMFFPGSVRREEKLSPSLICFFAPERQKKHLLQRREFFECVDVLQVGEAIIDVVDLDPQRLVHQEEKLERIPSGPP